MDLERRIADLERGLERHRRWNAFLGVLLVGVLGAGVASQQGSASAGEPLRTSTVEIVNADGQRAAVLGHDESGAGFLKLYGGARPVIPAPEKWEGVGDPPPAATPTVTAEPPFATLSAVRGGGQLDLGSAKGETTVSLGSTGYGASWGGFLRMISDHYPAVNLWTSDGTANFQLLDSDEEGGFLCGTRSLSSGRAGWMEIRNGQGASAVYLLSGAKGEGVIELVDDAGSQRTLKASGKATKGN